MKLDIETKSFLGSFDLAAGFAAAKSPREILKSLKLVAREPEAVLMGTDLDHGATVRVMGATIRAEGEVILPVSEVGDILRNATDERLVVECEGDKVAILGANSLFEMPVEDPALYPELPPFPEGGHYTMGAAGFRALIALTSYAASTKEDNRYALSCCVIEFGDDTATMAASDGGRSVAEMSCAIEPHGDVSALNRRPVTPARTLRLFAKQVADDDPPVHVAADAHYLMVRTEHAVMFSRLSESRFPPWRLAFPQFREDFRIKAGDLRVAAQQASVFKSEETRAVDVRFSPGTMTMSMQRAEAKGSGSKSRIVVPIEYDGGDTDMSVQAAYLVDPLKAVGDEAVVRMSLAEPRRGLLFKVGEEFVFVLGSVARQ